MSDWKKRLLRVKQKADQNLGRAEKTEVLTDDLHSLEKWVEQVKIVGHSTQKRVQGCLHQSTSTDKDKRLKKLPEHMLCTQMIEASASLTQLRQDSLMGQLMKTCGHAQGELASHCLEYEANVETGVLAPLHQLCEQDIPSIVRTRKNLSKMVLDMDMVKNRHQSALKQQSVGNMHQSKVDAIREELEDASSKVQSCKDQLSTDMYKFAASEPEYSKFLLNLVQAQADYHKEALRVLENIIPDMQKYCDGHQQMPVYGTPLEEHLRRTGRDIATVIEVCIATLAEFGVDEEGLFRIAGGASKVKKLKAAFDAGLVDMEDFISDVHCIAGALKLYLRELPEPLMTYQLYDEWMAAAHLGHEERMQQLWVLCDRLPQNNFNNLKYLIKFLAKLSENSEVNKMSPSNIAIVIGPNLIWPYGDGGPSVLTTTTQSAIVESLIQHADYFFPGEISFTCTEVKGGSPSPRASLRYKISPSEQKSSPIERTPSLAENSLTVAPCPAPEKLPPPAAANARPITAAVTSKQTAAFKTRLPSTECDDLQSVDSGIGSSGSASRRTSLKGNAARPGEVCRPSIILETSCGSDVTLCSVIENGNTESRRSCGTASSPRKAEESPRKAEAPPRSPLRSPASPMKSPPRSVHSDMYDTVFALQSLGNGWSDYLTKVRSLWDGHMVSSKRHSCASPPNGEPALDAKNSSKTPGAETKPSSFRDRARASSESRLLEVPVKGHLDAKLDTSLSAVEKFGGEERGPGLTLKRASFGGLQSQETRPCLRAPTRHSTAFEPRSTPSARTPRPDRLPTGSAPALAKKRASPPKSRLFPSAASVPERDIQFGLGASSEKGTPPGTLNAAPQGLYPNLEDMAVTSAPSLSPSASSNSLNPDRFVTPEVASPRTARKNKRAAPPPPGDKPTLRQNAPAPLERLEKPPTSEKPHVSPAGPKPTSPADRPSPASDRPTAPPPAPPKPVSPPIYYDAHTGTSSPARPPKPQLHEKPSNEKVDNTKQVSPAYDNSASLPYGNRPDISYIDAPVDCNNKAEKTNSLPRNANKPPRPPRPVTMCSREGRDSNEAAGSHVADAPPTHHTEKKPSVSEETHL